MGYNEDDSMIRVDFFKASGKWYCTEAVKWTGDWDDGLIHDEFAHSLVSHLTQEDGSLRLSEMTAIALEPYHQHAHPLMLPVARAVAFNAEREARRAAKKESPRRSEG